MNTPITNIAAYLFVSIENIDELKEQLQQRCQSLKLKGTILLANEGINLFLAGENGPIETFLAQLKADSRFASLEVKYSYSALQPFKKMLVKKKKEIITVKQPIIRPEEGRAPSVSAHTLSQWLTQGEDDEKRPVVLIDTRNAFETDFGTFENAIDYRIDKFSEFPEIIEGKVQEFDGKTVVTFCTGGIRCEKAAILMQRAGFERVYQLDGGILKYFEEAGNKHYRGDCFVFDEREALNPDLRATAQHETATRPLKA
jgi:UPF0176 protein